MFKIDLKKIIGKDQPDQIIGLDPYEDLKLLLRECAEHLNHFDEELIKKAFKYSFEAKKNKLRKSGDPYYTHPLSVALIVVNEMPLDDISVASALLHDFLDDNEIATAKTVREEFGSTVGEIVEGVTKIRTIESYNIDKSVQFEKYSKILLTLFTDVRIILIKLADRLHNLRTLQYLPLERQKFFAKESLEIYAPFAHRFGLGNLKWELEDLSFKFLNRRAFDEIRESLQGTRKDREKFIEDFAKPIIERLHKDPFLKRNNVKFEISGRPKHIYSIYNKMKLRKKSIDELYDLFAVRIIVDSNEPNLCFFVYGAVCEIYSPLPETFKNYISSPKKNGYQSIHTAVIGPENKPVEVQIRTRAMHEVSERGVASHFNYKSDLMPVTKALDDQNLNQWLDHVREIFEGSSEESPDALIESFRNNLYHDEIYVFTPKNELRALPNGATPLDFAFSIHSEVGYRCIGAKIYGKIAPLDYKLKSGDQIEILTSKNQTPKKEWLDFAVTSRARSAIHRSLKEQRRKIVSAGKKIWDAKLVDERFHLSEASLYKMIQNSKFVDIENFYRMIGAGEIDVDKAYEFIRYKRNDGAGVNFYNQRYASQAPISGKVKVKAEFAKCCYPLPGDKILGEVLPDGSIIVHRQNCPALRGARVESNMNIVKIDWDSLEKKDFRSEIVITGEDRPKMLQDITSTIISTGVSNIRGVSFDTIDSVFEGKALLDVDSLEKLKFLFDRLRHIEGVRSIERNGA